MEMESKVKSDNYISLGENIKSLRVARGFSQANVIREMQLLGCNTTKQNYSKYEKDLAHISASELVAISRIFDITLDTLFLPKK